MGARMIIRLPAKQKLRGQRGTAAGVRTSENMVWSMACRFSEIKGLLELGFQTEKAGHIGGSGQREGGPKVGVMEELQSLGITKRMNG